MKSGPDGQSQIGGVSIFSNLLDVSPSPTSCNTAQELDLRLVGGRTGQEGQVEILHGGVWVYVSLFAQYGLAEVGVACRQLGFLAAERRSFPRSYVPGDRVFDLWDLNCNGDEARLVDCYHEGLVEIDWPSSSVEPLGVVCTNVLEEAAGPTQSPDQCE